MKKGLGGIRSNRSNIPIGGKGGKVKVSVTQGGGTWEGLNSHRAEKIFSGGSCLLGRWAGENDWRREKWQGNREVLLYNS